MIRKCCPEDEKIWVELNREFMAYEYADENVWESLLDKGDPAVIFRRIMAEPDGANLLFMLEENGQPIGFMNTVVFIASGHMERCCFWMISLSENHFGEKAMGQLLLQSWRS